MSTPSELPGLLHREELDRVVHVIRTADRQNPADRVLKETLSKAKPLKTDSHARIVEAVYSVYRWQGALKEVHNVKERVREAHRMQAEFDADPGGMDADLLAHAAVPPWTFEVRTVTADWLRSLQRRPLLWLRTRSSQTGFVKEALGHCLASPFPQIPHALQYIGVEDLFRTFVYQQGLFEVQDVSSQAVGVICDSKPGETWWDACAGEGGKTLHLADQMQNKGLIWASDRSRRRLAVLRRRTARAGVFNYRAAHWVDTDQSPVGTRFDGVLIDAPCSGMGTWARNPHARWTTTLNDVHELADVQSKLLSLAAGQLKKGGRLIYAVCTQARPETEDVADHFAEVHRLFEPFPVVNPFFPQQPPQSRWFMEPRETSGNGMFVSAWKRLAEDI